MDKKQQAIQTTKAGLEKPSICSRTFGFLDVYNRKEQQTLKCPSGYNIGQCFNVFAKCGMHIMSQEIMIKI